MLGNFVRKARAGSERVADVSKDVISKYKHIGGMQFSSSGSLLMMGGACVYVGYKLATEYFIPMREEAAERPFKVQVPLADSHNAFFGIVPSHTTAHEPGTLFNDTRDVERPAFAAVEASELYDDLNLVLMQSIDYDSATADEVYYRSMHHLRKSSGRDSDEGNNNQVRMAKSLPTLREGEDLCHAMVRCKGFSEDDNCNRDIKSVPLERDRKMLLALSWAYMLQDPQKVTLPVRFTAMKEADSKVLLIGLGGGLLASYITSIFPQFHVDVVEPDAAHVRLARSYLGFKENDRINLIVDDPHAFIKRQLAREEQARKYDIVLVNLTNDRGRIPQKINTLQFLQGVMGVASPEAVVAVAVPSNSIEYLHSVVSSWRLGFQTRATALVHCYTEPYTIMFTFVDSASFLKPGIGDFTSATALKELTASMLQHFKRRVDFDLPSEVDSSCYCHIAPRDTLSVETLKNSFPETRVAKKAQPKKGEQSPQMAEMMNPWFPGTVQYQLNREEPRKLGEPLFEVAKRK